MVMMWQEVNTRDVNTSCLLNYTFVKKSQKSVKLVTAGDTPAQTLTKLWVLTSERTSSSSSSSSSLSVLPDDSSSSSSESDVSVFSSSSSDSDVSCCGAQIHSFL